MKLWQKDKDALKEVSAFTIGSDSEMDMHLARFDVLGSLAHIQMLHTIDLISKDELKILSAELKSIYHQILAGSFVIEAGVEDIHSQVELLLTKKLGDVGKRIHSGRSRNDQVLVDVKLFLRNEIEHLTKEIQSLFHLLILKSEEHKNKLLPGYTHLQLAMPSSFGLWFGAYAESLVDDLITVGIQIGHFNSTTVRLKVRAAQIANTTAGTFQFHYGTVKSIQYELGAGNARNFNSTTVRLKELKQKIEQESFNHFNSTTVRLKAGRTARVVSHTQHISIPLRYG